MGKKLFSGLVFLFCPIFLLAQAVSPVTPKRATITWEAISPSDKQITVKDMHLDQEYTEILIIMFGAMSGSAWKEKHVF